MDNRRRMMMKVKRGAGEMEYNEPYCLMGLELEDSRRRRRREGWRDVGKGKVG